MATRQGQETPPMDYFYISHISWWRHQIDTFSALLALCERNPPVDSNHKGQGRGALMLTLICAWTNGWVKDRNAGDLRRHRAHCDVIVKLGEIYNTENRYE